MWANRDATVIPVATTTAQNLGTIAMADQLNLLRERVPLSERDIARATGADEQTIASWLGRKSAPEGEQAARLSELVAVVQELTLAIRPETISPWLNRKMRLLGGRAPVEAIASGRYEQVREIAAELAAGTFT